MEISRPDSQPLPTRAIAALSVLQRCASPQIDRLLQDAADQLLTRHSQVIAAVFLQEKQRCEAAVASLQRGIVRRLGQLLTACSMTGGTAADDAEEVFTRVRQQCVETAAAAIIDAVTGQADDLEPAPVCLTPDERDALSLLAREPGAIVPFEAFRRKRASLHSLFGRLRPKVARYAEIHSHRGQGYSLHPRASEPWRARLCLIPRSVEEREEPTKEPKPE